MIYCKVVTDLKNAWSCLLTMVVSPYRKLQCSKCYNQLVGNFDVYLHAKNQPSFLTSFLRYCKDMENVLWKCLIIPIKIMVSNCSCLSCLNLCAKNQLHHWALFKNITKIANLLFLVISACLATHIYNDSINLKEPLIFINFILHVSLEIFAKILQTDCFGYFGHAWLYTPKMILSYYGKHLHLSAGKRSTSCLSGDFAWIMETSYFGYFGHASLKKPKIIVSNCRRLQCLSAC